MRTTSCRLRSLLWVPLLAASLLVAATRPTSAQVPARNFGELALKVKTGDTVYVTGDTGGHEDEARVLELTPALLVVSVDGLRRELTESQVDRIRQRVPDSRKNGALIGFLVGAAGATAGGVALASPEGSCKAGCIAANVAYGGGIGALVGLGIDALIQGRKDIYVKSDGRRSHNVGVSPFVSKQAKGLSLTVRF